MERLVEICCGSYEDALNAYYGRAKRIELNISSFRWFNAFNSFFEINKKEYKFKNYYNDKTKRCRILL